mgnify:CR=1 FL=1
MWFVGCDEDVVGCDRVGDSASTQPTHLPHHQPIPHHSLNLTAKLNLSPIPPIIPKLTITITRNTTIKSALINSSTRSSL